MHSISTSHSDALFTTDEEDGSTTEDDLQSTVIETEKPLDGNHIIADECAKCKEMSVRMENAKQEHELVTDTYIKTIDRKDEELTTQQSLLDEYRNTFVDASRLRLNISPDVMFKSKSKRRGGSTKQATINKCESNACEITDVDLVMCGICSRYVCETCNEVPISKLKSIMKQCRTIYFICKTCNENSETKVESTMEKNEPSSSALDRLQEELRSKLEVIKSIEIAQTSLNKLIEDKEEMIKSQKTIIEGLQKNNSSVSDKDDLIEARKIITDKETEISNHLKEIKRIKSEQSNQ